MPRQAKVKVELINSIPSDIEARKRLAKTVTEIVDLKRQIADLNEQIKDIRKVEKDDRGISPKFLNSLAKREYDVRYEAEKKSAALDAEQGVFIEADILFGRSAAIKKAEANLVDDADDGSDE